jgi:membrane-bound lytic murein transglycosylase B
MGAVRQRTLGWIGAGLLGVALFSAVAGTDREEPIRPELVEAYVRAVERLPQEVPGCQGLTWQVLAGIGRMESGHARGSEIDAVGGTDPRILGPRLDGSGAGGNTTPVLDSDLGLLDGDAQFDRAVGPMQFIPTSWELYGRDATGEGDADPHNVFDAALGAAVHLCGFTPIDLSDREELRGAVLRYNRSERYADTVLEHTDRYAERYAPDGTRLD